MATLGIVILKADVAEDGKTPVYLRFTHKGKPKYHSLKHRVEPQFFKPDSKKGTFLVQSAPHASRLNYLLGLELNNAKKTLLEMEIDKLVVNFENFMSRFRPLSEQSFSSWAFEQISKEVKERSLSEDSGEVYKYAIKKFVKTVGDLKIAEIDAEIIKKFKDKVVAQRSINTANTYLRSLHRFYAHLIDDHNVRDNKPFKQVTMETVLPKKKANLDEREEALFFEYWNKYAIGEAADFPETYYEDLRKYCFSLKTGLRKSDVEDLKFQHIVKEVINDEVVYFIYKIRIKGSKRIKSQKKWLLVPIVEEAYHLIDWSRNTKSEDHVFKKSTHRNSYNFNIRNIASHLGIQKHITTHTARHTFSERLLEDGKSDGDIARLLGNSKEVTRTFYAQGTKLALLNMITTTTKQNDEEMRKPIHYPDVTHSRTNTLRLNMVALRKKRGKEPVDMCKLIGEEGISLSQYTRFEDGKTNMSINYVLDFCRIFGVTLADLEKGNF